MDSEDAMQRALDIAAITKPKTSLQLDVYEMVAKLLNRLELLGENLLADYDEQGNTQLGGESHTLAFSMDSLKWEVKEGRTSSE